MAAAALSVALCAVGAFALEPLLGFLGADGQLLDLSLLYGRVLLAALPFSVLQNMFQSFFIAAEKPYVGLAVTVAAGLATSCWTTCSLRCWDGASQAPPWRR